MRAGLDDDPIEDARLGILVVLLHGVATAPPVGAFAARDQHVELDAHARREGEADRERSGLVEGLEDVLFAAVVVDGELDVLMIGGGVGGGVALSTRQFNAAVTPAAVSFTARSVIVTLSVEVGTTGKWRTGRIIGARFALSTEFTLPGVPSTVMLGRQF